MAVGAAVPMPRFWIWYTGCVGLCPSFSPLGGAGAAGGGGAVPSGVEAPVPATGPFPSSLGFMRTMGFSRGAGAGGAAGAAGAGGCLDYRDERVSASGGDPFPACCLPPPPPTHPLCRRFREDDGSLLHDGCAGLFTAILWGGTRLPTLALPDTVEGLYMADTTLKASMLLPQPSDYPMRLPLTPILPKGKTGTER